MPVERDSQPTERRVEFEHPELRVAVVEDDSESLHNPAWDVKRALSKKGFAVRRFAPSDAEALFAAQERYDAIVLGHNAAVRSTDLRAVLAKTELRTGLLVMQQRSTPLTVRLPGRSRLSLDIERAPATERGLQPVVSGSQLPLLHWPNKIEPSDLARCSLIQRFRIPPDEPWRVIVEAMPHRVPVLVAAELGEGVGSVVATTLLLNSSLQEHRKLVENALIYAALGTPAVVVVDEDSAWRRGFARKLRLYGHSVVSVGGRDMSPRDDQESREDQQKLTPGAARRLALADFPAKSARWVVERDSCKAPNGQNHPVDGHWLARGGRLVKVVGDGRAVTHHGLSDAWFIARAYSRWLQLAPEHDRWRTSILTCRAHLELLAELKDSLDRDSSGGGTSDGHRHPLESLGLVDLERLRDDARKLLEPRLDPKEGHIDRTISTTAAALDINRFVNDLAGADVLEEGEAALIERWLRDQFESASSEDRLDIARCLGDSELVARALEAIREDGRASPVAVLRSMRLPPDEAANGGAESRTTADDEEERRQVLEIEQQIAASLLFACEWVIATCKRSANAKHGHVGLFSSVATEEKLLDSAVSTINRRGKLHLPNSIQGATAEEVAREALARLWFGKAHPGPVIGVEAPEAVTFDTAGDELLKENTRLRRRLEDQRQELRSLELARNLLSVAAITVSLVASAVASKAVGTRSALGNVGAIGVWIAASFVVVQVLGYLLDRAGLWPRWARFALAALVDIAERSRDHFRQSSNRGVRTR
jgi:hypothetical protein